MDAVTDTLYVTDRPTVLQESTSQFDAIITICQDDVADNVGVEHYHHYPLSDGPPPADAYNPGEFSYDLFETAVETIIQHVEHDRVTLVHCHAGQSRSIMAVTAALTVIADQPFTDAFDRVESARSINVQPSRDLWEYGQQYAQDHGNHYTDRE